MNNVISEIIEELNREHEKLVLRSASPENEFDEAFLDGAIKSINDAIKQLRKLNSSKLPQDFEKLNGMIKAWEKVGKVVNKKGRS